MNTNPMTDQVNRLIGNRLAAGCDLFMPGIGSLYVEQIGARRVSKRLVEPPCRVVNFTSQERGASLVDEIVVAARCEAEKAQSIYDRWLDSVLGDNTLIIDGVGAIQFNNFIPEPEFERLLNPQGRTPVKVGAGGSGWMLWGGIVALVALLGIGYFVYCEYAAEKAEVEDMLAEIVAEESVADSSAANVPSAETPVAAANTAVPGAEKAAGAAQTPAPVAESRPQGTVEAPASLVSGHHYVVSGVFSMPENAARAVDRLRSDDPAVQCVVYRFGNKLMVSPFESANLEACQNFTRANRPRWSDIWIYSAR